MSTTPRIGSRVRELRRARGLTAEELATRAQLTPSFISQLERDLTSVSLSSLARISEALDVTIGQVADPSPPPRVLREHEQPATTPTLEGQHHRHLVVDERRFTAQRSRIEPGASAGDELYTLPADVELVYVVEGSLELRIDEEVVTLERGDALTYSPSDPHTWRNPSTTDDAVVVWFTIPNPYRR